MCGKNCSITGWEQKDGKRIPVKKKKDKKEKDDGKK